MPAEIGEYFNTISLGIGEQYAMLFWGFSTMAGGFSMAIW